MGGKDAIVAAEDADLEAAADGIAVSAFGYQGQKCS
jgi:1-pyrroline-5-carboxylate dehydrogenase